MTVAKEEQVTTVVLEIGESEYQQLEVVSYVAGIPPYTIRKLAAQGHIKRRFMEPQFRRFLYSVADAVKCALVVKRDPRRFDQRKDNGGHNKKDRATEEKADDVREG